MFLGQKVPAGLHYRINLQTGSKEAKLLDPEDSKTSMVHIEENKDDETAQQEDKNDVGLEQDAKRRLEEALKNIPNEKYDDVSEDKLREIRNKFRNYQELKKDLKEIKLEMHTENEVVKQLVDRFLTITGHDDDASNADKLTLLDELEYLSHSIDNSQYFVSISGLEKIIIPSLNQSNEAIVVQSLKTLGNLLQNNAQTKAYAIEKTNIGNYLINILSKSINNHNQLSPALFAFGSLARNNRKLPNEMFEKGTTVLLNDIIASEKSISLSLKTKALVLMDDLISSDELKDQDYTRLVINNLKLCKQLNKFFKTNAKYLIADADLNEKVLRCLASLKRICKDDWTCSSFRHSLLIIYSHSKLMLDSEDENLKQVYSDIFPFLDEINNFLFGRLRISLDDLSAKYDHSVNDEL